MNDKMILCPVGDQMRLVDHDLFIEIHEQLAAHYRQLGLTGHRLDLAIETHLPRRLEQDPRRVYSSLTHVEIAV